jgi:hypothetical protein
MVMTVEPAFMSRASKDVGALARHRIRIEDDAGHARRPEC